jgi:hypothetical protein
MDTFKEEKMSKTSEYFYCEKCDYTCCKKYNFDRHISSDKHKNTHFGYNVSILDTQNEQNEQLTHFTCECGKKYKYSQGLSKHKKKCTYENKESIFDGTDGDVKILTNMVLEVVKQNQELMIQNTETQKQNQELTNKLFEICKNGTNNTMINNNSHNKTFNLNVFLNEHCKDAMNIMDFVDSLKLQVADLENVGKLGFVEGISNIIVKNLKAMDIHKRPVHCSDSKREVMYIKDENKWEKEDEEKKKLRKAIKRIACKNQRLIPKFKEAHPDCVKAASKFSDQYNKMIIESMGGSGDNDLEKEDKIIKKIAKEVVIDKENCC